MRRGIPFLILLATLLFNANAKANLPKGVFQFDAANRLTNTTTPLGRETRLTYDARGLLSTVREPSTQTATNFFDAKGRLTNRTDPVGIRTYLYDANNNLTNIVEAGKTNTWTYDAYDRGSTYKDADGNLIQYRMDANGNLTNLIYPGNRTVTYAYDTLNRVTNVTDWANRKTSLEYDLASRVKKITRPNGTVRELNYDAAGQTTNMVEKSASAAIAFFKLNWNNAARMEWEFAAPLPHAYTPPTRTMTYDDDNRLLTFNGGNVVHDADGNMTSGPLTNNTLVSHTYDARNRLLSAGGLSYGYDPAGNRTAITNGANVTRLVVNPNAALSQVLMRVRPGVTNYYVHGLGLLYEITETATSTNTQTYHYDYRGSTVALTDGNGNVTDRIEYSPYATTTYRTGTNDTPFLFNGRYGVQTDPNGLLQMRARYYNPHICRFLNADPSGFSGGLNFYAYADGNPVSMMDPFGLGAGEVGEEGYWTGVGDVFMGYGDFISHSASGFWYAVTHSDQTMDALGSALLHPFQTGQGIWNGIANTFSDLVSGDNRKAGQSVAAIVSAVLPVAKAAAASDLIKLARAVDVENAAKGITAGEQVTATTIRNAMQDAPLASQQAGGVSLPRVQQYVDKILAGEIAPAIKVDGKIIVDGNHRYIAGRILGREPEVIQWPGGRPDTVVPWNNVPVNPEAW